MKFGWNDRGVAAAGARVRRIAPTLAAAVTLFLIAVSVSAQSGLVGIVIPAAGSWWGASNPYPATIAVSGRTGVITDLNVSLISLSHTWPDDLEVLLVSPRGTTALLMSDACGSFDFVGANLTFDDSVPMILAGAGPCYSGTYRLSAYDFTSFSAPAPAGPYGSSLSVFNGEDPNGTWSLYIYDDAAADSGSTGWRLDISSAAPTSTPTATAMPTGTPAPTDIPTMPPTLPPPPEVPVCSDQNFSESGVVRTGLPNELQSAVHCRVLYQNGESTTWLGQALYGVGNLGVDGLLDLGVQQAIDIFSPSGVTYFTGGGVFCLRGEGTLIWLAGSQTPRHAEIIGSYTVPEFAGFTCATLFEPGMLILVERSPVAP